MATGETVLYSCAQNMISAIKAFLKAKGTQELEVREPEVARPKCDCCLMGLFSQFIVQNPIRNDKMSKEVSVIPGLGRWAW